MKLRIALYLIVAWLLPPMVAVMAGWRGVWGSGSAGVDFLLPLPISGGALHVPSWLLGAGLVLLRQRGEGAGPWWGRVGAAAMAAVGLVLMVDMNAVALALSTDAPWPSASRWWTAHPLGLFLLCDGVLAWLWPGVRVPQATPRYRWGAVLLAAGLPALLLVSQWQQAPIRRHDLLMGQSRPGPNRGDEIVGVYTTLPMQAAPLAEAVRTQGLLPPLQQDVNVQDQAVMFFDSHTAARQLDLAKAKLTWCRYEDGSPDRWGDGALDCFSDHLNFAERLTAAYDQTDPAHTPDVRRFLARAALCRMQPGASECAGLARNRVDLLARGDLPERDRAALASAD